MKKYIILLLTMIVYDHSNSASKQHQIIEYDQKSNKSTF